MNLLNDRRIVLTLDAGGTNFVFSAIRGMKPVGEEVVMPSNADNLDRCLQGIMAGFDRLIASLDCKPAAISFAFPGPADYARGIIGDLGNLPAFRGGVALGPMLNERYGIPVFINNDGDLFTYGEAIAGLLPGVNRLLEENGSSRRYRNLLGVTLGTGFGAGLFSDGALYLGDNAAAAEIWLVRNGLDPDCFAEEGVSIRALMRTYFRYARGDDKLVPDNPKDLVAILEGTRKGDVVAAKRSFQAFGVALGDALANALTLTDSLVVIGGGLANAWPHFSSAMFAQLNGSISTSDGKSVNRLEMKVYNLEEEHSRNAFFTGESTRIRIPFSNRTVEYDPVKRVAVGVSRLGTSRAVAVGAYAFALEKLN